MTSEMKPLLPFGRPLLPYNQGKSGHEIAFFVKPQISSIFYANNATRKQLPLSPLAPKSAGLAHEFTWHRSNMIKLKILHKGLILVGAPLLTGICLNSLVSFQFYEVNRHVERELKFKDAIIAYIKASRCLAILKVNAYTLFIHQSGRTQYKKVLDENTKGVISSVKQLKSLLKDEPKIHLPEQFQSTRNMLRGDPEKVYEVTSSTSFMHELQEQCDKENQAASNSMQMLVSTVVLSVASIIIISL